MFLNGCPILAGTNRDHMSIRSPIPRCIWICGGHWGLLTPFHEPIKWNHHSKSPLTSALRQMKWSTQVALVDMSISLQRNVLPAWTTLQEWEREPISDSNSRFLQAFLPLHCAICSYNCVSFSSGRRSSFLRESNLIPRKTKEVVGPTDLEGSMGRLTLSHIDCIIRVFFRHSLVCRAPTIRKSSM